MGKMPVARCQTTTVINHDQLAIAVLPANKSHLALRAGNDRRTPGRDDVLPGMKLKRSSSEWITPAAKATFQFSLNRPDRRSETTFAQDGFVGAEVLFKAIHFAFQGREANRIEWQRRSTCARRTSGIVVNHT